jgi:hypothetical protein
MFNPTFSDMVAAIFLTLKTVGSGIIIEPLTDSPFCVSSSSNAQKQTDVFTEGATKTYTRSFALGETLAFNVSPDLVFIFAIK